MENFPANGEDVERALMDLSGLSELGGLLGVAVKEETPDPSQPNASSASTPQNPVSTGEPPSECPIPPEPCVICGENLMNRNGVPRLMDCLHSICEPCLNTNIEEKQNHSRDFLGAERITITCPSCRLQCSPANMIEQRFVIEKIAEMQQANNSGGVCIQQCNSCDDTQPATSYCVDCAEFICDNCVTAHQRHATITTKGNAAIIKVCSDCTNTFTTSNQIDTGSPLMEVGLFEEPRPQRTNPPNSLFAEDFLNNDREMWDEPGVPGPSRRRFTMTTSPQYISPSCVIDLCDTSESSDDSTDEEEMAPSLTAAASGSSAVQPARPELSLEKMTTSLTAAAGGSSAEQSVRPVSDLEEMSMSHTAAARGSSAVQPARPVSDLEEMSMSHTAAAGGSSAVQPARPVSDLEEMSMSHTAAAGGSSAVQPARPVSDLEEMSMSHTAAAGGSSAVQPARPVSDLEEMSMSHTAAAGGSSAVQPARPVSDLEEMSMSHTAAAGGSSAVQPARPESDCEEMSMSHTAAAGGSSGVQPARPVSDLEEMSMSHTAAAGGSSAVQPARPVSNLEEMSMSHTAAAGGSSAVQPARPVSDLEEMSMSHTAAAGGSSAVQPARPESTDQTFSVRPDLAGQTSTVDSNVTNRSPRHVRSRSGSFQRQPHFNRTRHSLNSDTERSFRLKRHQDLMQLKREGNMIQKMRLKITKEHTIKSKEEAVNDLPGAHDMFCVEHPQERLSLFCETCDVLTCRDCQLQRHRSHRYQFAGEMAVVARTAIGSMLQEVSYKRVLLASAMKVITDRQQQIAEKKKALVHEITQNVVKLTNAINSRGKQLVLRLNEVCDSKQRTLSEKKLALEQLARVTDHCVTFVNSALIQGSDTAVLHSKRSVCGHLQRIKSRRADIPNPEIPVRINFAIDNLHEVIAALSNIGSIVVDGKVESAPPPPAYPHASGAPHPHVANMHQSYAQTMSANGRGRSTPLRHAIVSSSTHPPPELQLRHLLHRQMAPRLAHPLHHQQQTQQQQNQQHQQQQQLHHQQQQQIYQQGNMFPVMNSYAAAGGFIGSNSHSPGNMATMTTAGRPNVVTGARWHIPEGGAGGPPGGAVPARPPQNLEQIDDYKISLRSSNSNPGVTSTLSSPSPRALDVVAQEAVSDLMATIAKLDSNGVQVLPETSPAPPVHSSTADPNEDWCAVCMDGGELMCCDHCPKVFHQYCHIPVIEKQPDGMTSWQCLLCVNFAELPPDPEGADEAATLSGRRRRAIERLTLELYCQYEPSLSFRASGLDQIRARLQPDHATAYNKLEQFVTDVRTMFREARSHNAPDSQIHKDANYLEEFFEAQLTKLIPDASWSSENVAPAPEPKRARLE